MNAPSVFFNLVKDGIKMNYKSFKIIDSHCHIFPDKIAAKATKSTDVFYGMTDSGIKTSDFIGSVDTLIKQCEITGVEKCLVTSVATTPHHAQSINSFIATQVRLYPDRFIGFGSLHPDSEDLLGDVEHLIDAGLKGVKLHPDIQNFKVDDPKVLKIFELCEKNSLPVLLHTGDYRFDNSNPDRVAKVLEGFPDLTIIGAHFGGWSVWEEAAKKLTKYQNFYVDTCSSFYTLDKDTAKKLIEAYGTHRVIFGTDFPMWKQADELEQLFSLGLSESELKNILQMNLLRVLKLA